MRYFMIDADQLQELVVLQERMHSEKRMTGDEMRDAGHVLESIVRVVSQMEVE
jgi:hypothetical protein